MMQQLDDYRDRIEIDDGLNPVHHLILFHSEISTRENEIIFIDEQERSTVSCNERYSSSIEKYFL